MGERKVLNKYFPPDFDPSKVPRGSKVRTEDKQMKVRMMLPMSVRCNTCGNFMYKGTKFNTRMEDVRGEDYLGIKIFRFYYRCTNCAAEFCMKTDPKTTDYLVEAGATRNYEPWREKERTTEAAKASREEEEKGNAMKALENRTMDSKREMDIMTALDEMKSLKARHETVDTEAALDALRRSAMGEEPANLDAEDEEAVRQMLLQRAGFVRRLSDSEGEGEGEGAAAGGAYTDEEQTTGPSSVAGGVHVRGTSSTAGAAPALKRTAAGGGGAGGKLKKARKVVGGPLSVAAAAFEDDEGNEGEGALEQRDGGNGGNGEFKKGETAVNGRTHEGTNINAVDGDSVLGSEDSQLKLGSGGAVDKKVGLVEGREKGVLYEPPPPSVPSFGAKKVGVVLKKKAQPAAAAPAPAESDGGSGGGGLLGLATYGSESD